MRRLRTGYRAVPDRDRAMNEREIFTEALHLPADVRDLFLATACGDNRELRDRVNGSTKAFRFGER